MSPDEIIQRANANRGAYRLDKLDLVAIEVFRRIEDPRYYGLRDLRRSGPLSDASVPMGRGRQIREIEDGQERAAWAEVEHGAGVRLARGRL